MKTALRDGDRYAWWKAIHQATVNGVAQAMDLSAVSVMYPILDRSRTANRIMIFLCAERIPARVLCNFDGCRIVGIPAVQASISRNIKTNTHARQLVGRCRDFARRALA